MSKNSGESQLPWSKFSESITQGLSKLEEINKLPSSPHLHKLQQQIIEDHVFNFQNTSNSHKPFAPIEELMIVRCIAQYIAKVIDPANRNALFIILFPAVSNEPQTPLKIGILSSLISLAVATHNVAVLDATAVWMQQVGCFSDRCRRVCYGLIQDYFQGTLESPAHFMMALKALPTATPLFTANLLTSLAEVFAKVGTNHMCDEPPLHFIKIVVHWLRTNSFLALTPLTTSLPGISLPMIAVLPIAPLAKLCIEAPFFSSINKKEIISEDEYSELHLLLLQTLQSVASIRSQMTQREVICAEHLKNIGDVLYTRMKNCDKNSKHLEKEVALNRLSQIVLVSLHTDCLSGRIAEMWNSFKKLPNSPRLMKTLMRFSPGS